MLVAFALAGTLAKIRFVIRFGLSGHLDNRRVVDSLLVDRVGGLARDCVPPLGVPTSGTPKTSSRSDSGVLTMRDESVDPGSGGLNVASVECFHRLECCVAVNLRYERCGLRCVEVMAFEFQRR